MGITFSQVQAGAYALVLAEEKGSRRMPIIIGTPEAQSIAIFLEGLHPPRPLTHDLFITFIEKANIQLKEIFIYKFSDGVFFSDLTFIQDGNEIKIDSRTSDAIALAIRARIPIYTTETILTEAGILMEEDADQAITQEDESVFQSDPLKQEEALSEEDLKQLMNEAIANEDYEKASKIKDILMKRKS